MAGIQTARARVRAEITSEITTEARRQLGVDGPAGLSLRAVARELGMASSGIYRYFASRDELLTRLIVDAYDAVGERAEQAAAGAASLPPTERLVATCRAIRAWAQATPHEYALVYGTPVPGYEAPAHTIGPASRATLALVGVVADAHRQGLLQPSDAAPMELSPALRADLDLVLAEIDAGLPAGTFARLLVVWTQVFGLISFELFGQTRNVITAHDDLFDSATRTMARFVGLTDGR